ncbi:MAG: acyl-ACP--UDP-N-acetylglucosamine O-acyltransferase [Planctomycetes bacterium]|nr:acyl-ACP--UDP-N-acetylglucosamine O-acyltransferase [Planctomycetota bacterium]
MAISKLAVVSPKAELAADVEVGPFCYIGPDVRLDAGTVLHPGVTIVGCTRVGKRNTFYPNSIIGTPPQDITYRDEPTRVEIGDDNVFREGVTVHRGTTKDAGLTRIGNRCYLMACSHVAHDCHLEDQIIFGNNVLIGGHVHVQGGVNVNGGAAIHPFTTIGRLAYVGGLTRIVQDVPPFMIVEGHPSQVRGVNVVGMQRADLSEAVIEYMARACRRLFPARRRRVGSRGEGSAMTDAEGRVYRRMRPRAEVLDEMEKEGAWPDEVRFLCEFLRNSGSGRHGRYRESLRKKPPA